MRKRRWFKWEWLFAVPFVMFAGLLLYALWVAVHNDGREWQPHKAIAGAIFCGLLLVAWSLDRIADAIKDRARPYSETPESKAIKQLAEAVERLARKG